MKRLLSFLILLPVSLAGICSAKKTPQEVYIRAYNGIAVKEMHRCGIPASITLAQGLLESDAGQSVLAREANNHFGIKCHDEWTGGQFYMDDDSRSECFRVYDKVKDSFRDHSEFLCGRDRYKELFSYETTDYRAWAHGLSRAGYATDPQYAGKLIKLIEDYGLYRFDQALTTVRDTVRTVSDTAVPDTSAPDSSVTYSEAHTFSLSRPVYEEDGVPYIYAGKGETYKTIARAHGLLTSELRRFNNAGRHSEPSENDKVYLSRKSKKLRHEKESK